MLYCIIFNNREREREREREILNKFFRWIDTYLYNENNKLWLILSNTTTCDYIQRLRNNFNLNIKKLMRFIGRVHGYEPHCNYYFFMFRVLYHMYLLIKIQTLNLTSLCLHLSSDANGCSLDINGVNNASW